MLSLGFGDNTVIPWTPQISHGFLALDFSTRYLSRAALTPVDEFLDPLDGVDPDGALARLMGDTFVHAFDNEVLYLQPPAGTGAAGSVFVFLTVICVINVVCSTLLPIRPAKFNVGDLVEVRASPRLVWLHDSEKWTMKLALRAIVLLDDSFSSVRDRECTLCDSHIIALQAVNLTRSLALMPILAPVPVRGQRPSRSRRGPRNYSRYNPMLVEDRLARFHLGS